MDNLTRNIKAAAAAYISFQGAAKVTSGMISAASSLESYRNTLNVVMKDQKKAAETMAWAVQFANKTPFETDSVVEATVKLESYGLKAADVMGKVGDMAGVMNKDLIQAVEAVADAQNGELERLKEFGITKQQIIEHGQSKLNLMNLVNNKGQISDQDKFNQALFSLMESRFEGGMKIQASSYKGIMSTISGVWKTGLASMSGVSMTGEVVDGSLFHMIKVNSESMAKFLTKQVENGTFERAGEKIAAFFKFIGYGIDLAKDGIKKAWPYIQKTGKILKSMIHMAIKSIKRMKPTLMEIASKMNWLKLAFMNGFNKVKLIVERNIPVLERFKDNIVHLSKKVKNGLAYAFDFAKPFVSWLFDTGFPLVADGLFGIIGFAGDLYDNFSTKWTEIQPIVESVGDALKNGLLKAFETVEPIIEYMIDEGLPFMAELIGEAADMGMELFTVIYDNWGKFEPIVAGLVAGLVTYKAVMLGLKIATMAQTAWTTALTIATGALSTAIAILTSPITLVVVAVAGLVAAGWALWKNWDEIMGWFKEKFAMFVEWVSPIGDAISNAFSSAYDFVIETWNGIGDFFTNLWDGVTESGKGFINFFIKGINWMIDGINKLSFTVPDWIPEIGGKHFGFDLQHIPFLAKGGVTTGPTLAMIGEGKEQEAVLPLSTLKGLFELAVLRARKMDEREIPMGQSVEDRFNNINSINQKSTIILEYKPEIKIYGKADKRDVEQVLEKDKQSFTRESKKLFDQKKRLAFR